MRKLLLSFISCLIISTLSAQDADVHTISRLTKSAENEKYGLTGEMPVKVGKGPKGGPANQRAYLDLLRDMNGEPLKYSRIGSCCQYQSENGFMGFAMVDRYEVKYKDEQGKEIKAFIYISFYDFEEPMIPKGFKTVKEE